MLRSIKDLHYYGLHAIDGNMGVVYSVLFEDVTWTVRYLVVDTGTWLPGRQVLIAPVSLGVIDWETQRISVTLTMDQIKQSPSIDTDQPVSRQHEAVLAAHYGWPSAGVMHNAGATSIPLLLPYPLNMKRAILK